jgi:hypothetical protein
VVHHRVIKLVGNEGVTIVVWVELVAQPHWVKVGMEIDNVSFHDRRDGGRKILDEVGKRVQLVNFRSRFASDKER